MVLSISRKVAILGIAWFAGCSPGTINSNSSVGDPCDGHTCSGHGTCAAPGGTPTCSCETGYHSQGPNCVLNSAPCSGQTCSGHGTCTANGSDAVCTCASGYHPGANDPLACIADALCVDADHDTFGENCAAGDDCDDSDPAVHQLLNGYVDTDGDGFGHGQPVQV